MNLFTDRAVIRELQQDLHIARAAEARWMEEAKALASELAAIRRSRSAATAKGNATRKAARDADVEAKRMELERSPARVGQE